MTVVIRERLEAVADVKLDVGAHDGPPDGDQPGAFCVMEKFAWVTGEDWTDNPDNCSRVISAFLRRWNDTTDQAGRDALDEWVIQNADRLVATANDGLDRTRGYLAADWAVRTAAPVWLELAGAADAAQQLRDLAPITDGETSDAAYDATLPIRQRMWARRDEILTPLREKMRDAAVRAFKDKVAVEAAEAAVAAVAVEAVEAAVAAVAVEAYWPVYDRVYKAVREKLAEVWTPKIREKLGPQADELKAGAMGLLERMVTLGEQA